MDHSQPCPRPVALLPVDYFSFHEQRELGGLRIKNDSSSLDEFERTFRLNVGDVCHRFGVHVKHGSIYLRGNSVIVFLDLAAGDWSYTLTFRGHRDKNPIRRLCDKTLRLLSAENENLG